MAADMTLRALAAAIRHARDRALNGGRYALPASAHHVEAGRTWLQTLLGMRLARDNGALVGWRWPVTVLGSTDAWEHRRVDVRLAYGC
jgi:hypothetical protein